MYLSTYDIKEKLMYNLKISDGSLDPKEPCHGVNNWNLLTLSVYFTKLGGFALYRSYILQMLQEIKLYKKIFNIS